MLSPDSEQYTRLVIANNNAAIGTAFVVCRVDIAAALPAVINVLVGRWPSYGCGNCRLWL